LGWQENGRASYHTSGIKRWVCVTDYAAASIATRTFMQRTQQFNPIFYPMILPAMCLNRYYGAEGLRLYSQDSWQMLMGSTGRDEVAKSVDNFLDYYVTHASAENRLVREAACHCIAELLVKIDPEVLSTHS
jgi:hypothetical protein